MSDQFDWRQHLKVHPAAELFPRLLPDELKELAEDILKNGLKSNVAVVEDDDGTRVLDGISRLDAMQSVGLLSADRGKSGFVVLTKQWTGKDWADYERPEQGPLLLDDPFLVLSNVTDPYAYVISANIHRRHLSAEGKRNLIAKVLKAKPDASNLAIAKQVKADDKTVAKVRSDLEGRSEIPNVKKRVDSKGRGQPANKPPPKAMCDRVGIPRPSKAERKAISRDTGIDKKARMIWRWLTAVEKEGYLTVTPKKILQTMTPDMRADMHRLGASVGQWLLTVAEAAGEGGAS
jgi:hypothetical protein